MPGHYNFPDGSNDNPQGPINSIILVNVGCTRCPYISFLFVPDNWNTFLGENKNPASLI